MPGFINRVWTTIYPPVPVKTEDAIRFGILGAANIAPIALINPAKSHPEVIIAAVAARDITKAEAFAKANSIPIVHKSYQELLDDPSINAVYIPLPNGLHYEWTIKALQAGKHVLLEKPSTSNTAQAESLFHHPILKPSSENNNKPPILLEAFHSVFHPALQTFFKLCNKDTVEYVKASGGVPKYQFPKDDIRFRHELAGGATMDFGTYYIMLLRNIFGTEPEECIETDMAIMPQPFDQNCESSVKAKFRFPNGGIGEIDADLMSGVKWGGGWFSWIPSLDLPIVEVRHKEEITKNPLDDELESACVRTVKMSNFLAPSIWHKITVQEEWTTRRVSDKVVLKKWTGKERRWKGVPDVKKVYTWPVEEGSEAKKGEDWWTTYRYELEEFVDRVKGRKGNGVWMSGEDSIGQMKAIDSVYEKAGLPLRPGEV
ncbi:putative oxidoreductase [Tricladium varicosporioides]|nr:putative oxidoreductase [Hymenoscyphus varicosporioides]